jgi:hypothetical protein
LGKGALAVSARPQAVAAIIIPWDGGLGVSYTYRDGFAEAGPIGPTDWPVIHALEREGKLSFTSKRVQNRFGEGTRHSL